MVYGVYSGYNRTDRHGCEDCTGLLDVKAMLNSVYEGYGSKGEIKNGPRKGDPERKEEYDRFGYEEV